MKSDAPVYGSSFAAAVVIALISAVTGCGEDRRPATAETTLHSGVTHDIRAWPADDRRTRKFVGSSACRECHPAVFDSYFDSHPMANSARPAEQQTGPPADSLPVVVESYGVKYTASAAQGKWQQAMAPVSSDSASSNPESDTDNEKGVSVRTDVVVGSGTRGLTLLHLSGPVPYQAPLTWYASKQQWDLSPGYTPQNNPGFGRRVSEGCLQCHIGHVNFSETAPHQLSDPPVSEYGIGCERCHGPGENHIAAAHAADMDPSSSIVNPGDLSPSASLSVCLQCHLHGHGRILRAGRSETDFRPGDALHDIWITMIDDSRSAAAMEEFRAVSHAEQLFTSRCFTASDGQMTCVSCHDPHRRPPENERRSYFDGRCASCHHAESTLCSRPPADGSAERSESCIDCHMPRSAAGDVPHTSVTNHRIPRKVRPALPPGPTSVTPFIVGNADVSESAVRRAVALFTASKASGPSECAAVLRMLEPFSDEDVAVAEARIEMLIECGRTSEAMTVAERTREDPRSDQTALRLLARQALQQGMHERAAELLEELRDRDPWNARIRLEYARALRLNGRTDDAIDAFEAALRAAVGDAELTSAIRAELNELTASGRDAADRRSIQEDASEAGGPQP